MKSFIKVQVGDIVFDEFQSIEGKVIEINQSKNTAKVQATTDEDEIILSRLANLTVLQQSARKTANKVSSNPLKIKIKYFNPESTKLSKITKGDWIDLRSAVTIELKAGESTVIPLGVAMKLPDNHEAYALPRSNTFKTYGIIQTNSKGIIDNSYSGNDDQWGLPVYATRDTKINFDDRICQFRIQEKMPEITFEEVDYLEGDNRGGFGSTGIK
jgi:dUTP pyrophosphatase